MSNSHKRSIFISYSHKDEKYKDELLKMIKPLIYKRVFDIWHDRMIDAGDSWNEEIERELRSCYIAILLVSKDFLASRYIFDQELTILLQRRQYEDVLVIPIILEDCLWKETQLAQIQALPQDARPVKSFKRRDVAWTQVAEHLSKLHQKSVKRRQEQDELAFQRRKREVIREQAERETQQRVTLNSQSHEKLSQFYMFFGVFVLVALFMMLPKHDVTSYPTDLETLQQLEKSLGWKLVQLQDIQWNNTIGVYQLNSNNELVGLGLSSFALVEVPQEVYRFKNLNKLYLGDNQLVSLSEDIKYLKQLKVLYLRNNKLAFLPSGISQLSQLQTLDLGNNQLDFLPKEIASLNQLHELYLDKNPLQSPPSYVVQQGMPAVMQFLREK